MHEVRFLMLYNTSNKNELKDVEYVTEAHSPITRSMKNAKCVLAQFFINATYIHINALSTSTPENQI